MSLRKLILSGICGGIAVAMFLMGYGFITEYLITGEIFPFISGAFSWLMSGIAVVEMLLLLRPPKRKARHTAVKPKKEEKNKKKGRKWYHNKLLTSLLAVYLFILSLWMLVPYKLYTPITTLIVPDWLYALIIFYSPVVFTAVGLKMLVGRVKREAIIDFRNSLIYSGFFTPEEVATAVKQFITLPEDEVWMLTSQLFTVAVNRRAKQIAEEKIKKLKKEIEELKRVKVKVTSEGNEVEYPKIPVAMVSGVETPVPVERRNPTAVNPSSVKPIVKKEGGKYTIIIPEEALYE